MTDGNRHQPEHQLQCAVMEWAALHLNRWPELDLLYATNQPRPLTKPQAWRNKRAGIKAGFPDLHLPVPIAHNPPYQASPGLWLELKATGKSPSLAQTKRIESLKELGHEVHVIHDAELAANILADYMARVYASRKEGQGWPKSQPQ